MSGETAGVSRRKEGITSNQHGLYVLGHTRATMESTKGCQPARGSQSHQNFPQFRLRAATRPHEVGIASNRGSACHGEYVLESCTHRPSYQGSREWLKLNFSWATPSSIDTSRKFILPRKEMIHPQLPLRMPCYDLCLVTELTFTPAKRGLGVFPASLH